MKTYPIMLDLHDKLAVVIGGGNVGLRKVDSLLAAGATVRLVSPDKQMPEPDKRVELLVSQYNSQHVQGATLVFACTDNPALNEQVATDARNVGALVNAADQPAQCDFFAPAVVRDGDLTVAIGTGGNAPALAGLLKKKIASSLAEENLGQFAELIGAIREELKNSQPVAELRMKIVNQLVCEDTIATFATAGPHAVRERLRQIVDGIAD